MQTRQDPTRPEAPPDIRGAYLRAIANWAQDALELRRRGLDVPGHRTGDRRDVLASIGPVDGATGMHHEEAA